MKVFSFCRGRLFNIIGLENLQWRVQNMSRKASGEEARLGTR